MMTDEADIRRVWTAMLDDPAPPLPTAAETLAAARGSARRRTLVTLAAAGAAGAVVVATVGVGLAFGGGHPIAPAPEEPAAPAPSVRSTPSRPPVAPPRAPSQQAADQHGEQTAALLMGAVPAGLTGLVQEASPGAPAWTWQIGSTPEYVSTVYVVLTTGQADGLLSADLHGGLTNLGTDVCSARVITLAAPAGAAGCQMVDVNGVAIGVVVTRNELGQVITAVRLLAGGLLSVQSQQGIEPHQGDGHRPPDAKPGTGSRGRQHDILGGWPALSAPPLTAQQVAALAANPGLLT